MPKDRANNPARKAEFTNNVKVLPNLTADYAYDNKWEDRETPEEDFKTARARGTITGHEGEHGADVWMDVPGSRGVWRGASALGTTTDDSGDNYQDTPNKARQIAYNRASDEYVRQVKSGEFVRKGDAEMTAHNSKQPKKAAIKINSNPVKGK